MSAVLTMTTLLVALTVRAGLLVVGNWAWTSSALISRWPSGAFVRVVDLPVKRDCWPMAMRGTLNQALPSARKCCSLRSKEKFLARASRVLAFVTAFTLGHTVTLLGATLLGLRVNSYLIDAAIALTVLYVAFENMGLFRRWGIAVPDLIVMVLLFGLGQETRADISVYWPVSKRRIEYQDVTVNQLVVLGEAEACTEELDSYYCPDRFEDDCLRYPGAETR